VKTIIVLGSSRSDGNTRALVDNLAESYSADILDLNQFHIQAYCYSGKYNDDFKNVMQTLLNYERIFLATPMYWYSASGTMKIFLDRWCDLLTTEKSYGRMLRGKHTGLLATGHDLEPPACFEQMFSLTFEYLGMKYDGMKYISHHTSLMHIQPKATINTLSH
jgi:multimeric flavodoxin WrbA